MAPARPRILVLLRPSLYEMLFTPQTDQALRELGDFVFQDQEENLSSDQLAGRIASFEAIITGWGTPRFNADVLATAHNLRLIAHSAGSIKAMLPPPVFEQGIAVSHAAAAIAPAVAEMTILLILLCLRRVHQFDDLLKAGRPWADARVLGLGQEIGGRQVGVVGAGYTGRQVIERLQGLKADVAVYDPYLSPTRAAELGARKLDLDELLATSPIVTIQAPPTDETYHMIGPRQLSRLQDGAIFINTARSRVVDQEALLDELQSGRIQAALDVFDQEPLPEGSPFRKLDNVILTPHIAGASLQARQRQGQIVVDEIRRFFNGEALRYQVTGDMRETMA